MDSLTDEIRTLRRCVRDVVALSALSVAWGRIEPHGIAESLADVFLDTVEAEFVYVHLKGLDDRVVHEAARSHHGPGPAPRMQQIGRVLEPLLKSGSRASIPVIPNPVGDGAVRIAIVPIGYEGDCGSLVAASLRSSFPDPSTTTLVLNQA